MAIEKLYDENRFYSWEQDCYSPFSVIEEEFEQNGDEQIFDEITRLNMPFETKEVLLESFDKAYKSKYIADFTNFARVREIRRSKILVWLDRNVKINDGQ